MLEIVMAAKMHSQETLFRTIAAQLNERLQAPHQKCPDNPAQPDPDTRPPQEPRRLTPGTL